MLRFPIRLLIVSSLLATIVGCETKTSVSGKVTYQGAPVTAGSVTLVASSGNVYTGNLNPDGTFTIPDVPTGDVQVAVVGANAAGGNKPPPARGAGPVGAKGVGRGEGAGNPEALPPPPVATGPVLPKQYGDPRTSGLTAKVKAGEPLNIDLK